MTLAEDLATPIEGPGRNTCALVNHLREHPEDKVTLLAAVASPRWSGKQLAAVLNKNGIRTSDSSIRRHRRGECAACREMGYSYDTV